MILKKIYIENFRNIEKAELEFSPAANIFFGDNAQGKTNLLEAIAIALGKSFRGLRNSPITPFNKPNAKTLIKLYYEYEHTKNQLNEIIYQAVHEKHEVKINSIPLKKATDLYGEFKYVIFIPDNLNLVKGYPDIRRYYLDNIAVMQNKTHKKIQREYKEALKQRCAACVSNRFSGDSLAVWDDILIKQGINLTYGRIKYLDLLREYAAPLYKKLSNGEKLDIIYKSDVFGNNIDFSARDNLYKVYKNALDLSGNEGLQSKVAGSHKDDISFLIQGKSARNFGSQGQLRSIAVTLKLSEAQLICEFNRENPVVLLDEVLGELDRGRREFVIKYFQPVIQKQDEELVSDSLPTGNSQVFITSCNISDFEALSNIKIWGVTDGCFYPQ